jgi:thiamine-phosphate pyrophosphorylase
LGSVFWKMLLYAISDRRLLSSDENECRRVLVELARKWARGGVDYVQVREKDLEMEELRQLTQEIVAAVRSEGTRTRVLLNGPAAVALAVGADGVHLPGNATGQAREAARGVFAAAGREAVISQAVHSSDEAAGAKDASLILFAPVFEKVGEKAEERAFGAAEIERGVGLAALAEACRAAHPVAVMALGGVTAENARACIDAGAAGIAAIRLFVGEEWRGLR